MARHDAKIYGVAHKSLLLVFFRTGFQVKADVVFIFPPELRRTYNMIRIVTATVLCAFVVGNYFGSDFAIFNLVKKSHFIYLK